jgi:hypothetical protein
MFGPDNIYEEPLRKATKSESLNAAADPFITSPNHVFKLVTSLPTRIKDATVVDIACIDHTRIGFIPFNKWHNSIVSSQASHRSTVSVEKKQELMQSTHTTELHSDPHYFVMIDLDPSNNISSVLGEGSGAVNEQETLEKEGDFNYFNENEQFPSENETESSVCEDDEESATSTSNSDERNHYSDECGSDD